MKIITLAVLAAFSLSSCLTDLEPKDFPTTVSCDEVDRSSNLVEGELRLVGKNISEYGHCWSLANPPSILDATSKKGPTGAPTSFTSRIMVINSLETHFYSSYCIDEDGDIFYSDIKSYRPL